MVENQWFSGKCDIVTYNFNELIGTKIRALYQRKKGRDLFDIYTALQSGLLNVDSAIYCYKKYIASQGLSVPTATEYAKNLEAKMKDAYFYREIFPFLSQNIEYDINEAYKTVCDRIVNIM